VSCTTIAEAKKELDIFIREVLDALVNPDLPRK
jgi:hypothetical protein